MNLPLNALERIEIDELMHRHSAPKLYMIILVVEVDVGIEAAAEEEEEGEEDIKEEGVVEGEVIGDRDSNGGMRCMLAE